jgi:hypothetical protein
MTREKTPDQNRKIEEAIAIATAIKPLLAGYDPDAQGAALAELVGHYLGGYRPDIRPGIRKAFFRTCTGFGELVGQELWTDDGKPRASFTCPVCGRTSYHPKDIAEHYCGACHKFFPA